MKSLDIALYIAAGLALGVFYFYLLYRTVRLHVANTAASRILPLYLIRIVLVVAVLWVIAQQGAMPLLLATLGFLIARLSAQRWLGSSF
ncbi:MAG: N-ATPase subunit AtpR [Alphaproteobacteria bacterium]